MKKTLTKKMSLLLLVFISGVLVRAQDNESHFGLKAGMNMAGLSDLELGADAEQKMRFSFAGGLFFNQEINSKNSIHVEALYSFQGADVRWENQPDEVLRMDYITVPVYFRHHFKENRAFSIQLGVQAAFLANGQVKVTEGTDSESYELNDYFASKGVDMKVKTFDLGVSAGLGFGFGGFSTITLTYTQGLMGAFDGADAPEGAKNYLIQLGLCIPLTSNSY